MQHLLIFDESFSKIHETEPELGEAVECSSVAHSRILTVAQQESVVGLPFRLGSTLRARGQPKVGAKVRILIVRRRYTSCGGHTRCCSACGCVTGSRLRSCGLAASAILQGRALQECHLNRHP